MPSKKQRARERRAASRSHTRVDATNMPEATRVYIAVGELIPELADFAVQTTHGEVQAAIAAAQEQLAAGDDPAVVASVRDSLTRYPARRSWSGRRALPPPTSGATGARTS